ncbi:WGR domain-containing protein [Amycolatopsis saalfeldensis]|uniref:WGR domain-containing protein n=2 Tax=Pseudonocardiaceae TaxID=2070 RepID=A0A1H8YNB6_9PSEU|nr:WGR domain-containing protein [Amycolatopsis saalfeldensis]
MTSGGSDKYYRLLLVENTLLVNYGRRNARGQFQAHRKGTAEAAQRAARDLTNQKNAKGYRLSRDMTVFEVPQHLALALTTPPPGGYGNPAEQVCDEVVTTFKNAALQQETERGEASW